MAFSFANLLNKVMTDAPSCSSTLTRTACIVKRDLGPVCPGSLEISLSHIHSFFVYILSCGLRIRYAHIGLSLLEFLVIGLVFRNVGTSMDHLGVFSIKLFVVCCLLSALPRRCSYFFQVKMGTMRLVHVTMALVTSFFPHAGRSLGISV